MRRGALGVLAGLWFATLPAFGYAHFLHYGPNGEVIPERFDLAQIPVKTVTFYVSDAGPGSYSPNDSFPSVLNQIRQAADTWNAVSTSDLRVAFGGLYTKGTADNSPGGEVVFEDLPPGVLAYSGPTTCEDPTPAGPSDCASQVPPAGATFLPILRSTMHMSKDLTKLPGPSFSETFYLVSVHEMGHALGLQHTFTSSVMSTFATRSTSLRDPLGADDRAGISDLYPTAAFSTQFGSISGRVTYTDDGSNVHMASVIAMSSTAPTVSALTLADGTFQIRGVQAGQYFLYVQPLPPSADIRSPQDSNGNAVEPTRPFNAVLYPNELSVTSAAQVAVGTGHDSGGNNFQVRPRSSVPIYDISLYSYFYPDASNLNDYVAVHPAYLGENSQALNPAVVAAIGSGLGSGSTKTSGLNIQTIGGTATISRVSAAADASGNTVLYLYFSYSTFGTPGAQHLMFATRDYLYLLPAAFHVAVAQPPSISSVSANSDGTLTVAGQGFTADTKVYFDALPALAQSAATAQPNQFTITPPAGASGQTATLTAYNSDGQNSMFLQLPSPQTYLYPTLSAPTLTLNPATLPAGAEAMVDITGTNTNFMQGRTLFGFGSHDVIVRNTFVLSPSHAIVDVGMPLGAAQITTQVTAMTDFQVAIDGQAFQIAAPQPGLPAAAPILVNAVAGQAGAFPGAVVSLYGSNLQASSSSTPVVTFNGFPASLLYSSPNLINLTIPSGLTAGLATLLVNNGSEGSLPVTVNIDPPEPVIVGIQLTGNGQALDSTHAAQAGQAIDVLLSGFAGAGTVVDPSRVQVNAGGVNYPAATVSQVGTTSIYDVRFTLTNAVAAGNQTVIVYIDRRSSVPATIAVTAPGT